jgi:hypothetical protein
LVLLKRRLREEVEQWLPAYAGGLIYGWRRLLLKWWLDRDATARQQLGQIERIRQDVRRQPQEQPAAEVYLRIQAAVAEEVRPAKAPGRPIAVWATTILIALVALVLVWQALPPGISLEWSVEGELPTAFRVYRAPATADSLTPGQPFTLLDELQANEAAAAYQFTDWLPLPGRDYVYRVEALDQTGEPVASQVILSRWVDALPAQLSVAAISVTVLLVIYLFYSKYWSIAPHRSMILS